MEVVEEETVLVETKIDELPLEQDSITEIPDAKKEELNDKAPDPETDGKGQTFLF